MDVGSVGGVIFVRRIASKQSRRSINFWFTQQRVSKNFPFMANSLMTNFHITNSYYHNTYLPKWTTNWSHVEFGVFFKKFTEMKMTNIYQREYADRIFQLQIGSEFKNEIPVRWDDHHSFIAHKAESSSHTWNNERFSLARFSRREKDFPLAMV